MKNPIACTVQFFIRNRGEPWFPIFENSTGEEEIRADGIVIPDSINNTAQERMNIECLSFLSCVPRLSVVSNALATIFTIRGIQNTAIQKMPAMSLFADFV